MSKADITPAEAGSTTNWSLLAKFVPSIALTLLFIAWLVMGRGKGGSD